MPTEDSKASISIKCKLERNRWKFMSSSETTWSSFIIISSAIIVAVAGQSLGPTDFVAPSSLLVIAPAEIIVLKVKVRRAPQPASLPASYLAGHGKAPLSLFLVQKPA